MEQFNKIIDEYADEHENRPREELSYPNTLEDRNEDRIFGCVYYGPDYYITNNNSRKETKLSKLLKYVKGKKK